MASYEWALLVAGIVLQVLVLSTLLRGAIRHYPFVFLYIVVQLLSTVVQISCKYYFGAASKEFARAYWLSDLIGTLLVLLIIIHLIHAALETYPFRQGIYFGLLSGVVVTALVGSRPVYAMGFVASFWGKWMTQLGRDFYFAAVMLNALLWVALVRAKHPNKQVYLLTSGLGLQLSGAAVAHALRLAGGPKLWPVAGLFLVLTWMANLIVWYLALHNFPSTTPVMAGGPEHHPQPQPSDPRP